MLKVDLYQFFYIYNLFLFFLGELIGVEYLFSQTGRVLQYIAEDTEETSGPLCDLDQSQEDDEGFVDDADDQTVAPAETVLATQQSNCSNVSGEELTLFNNDNDNDNDNDIVTNHNHNNYTKTLLFNRY